MAVAASSKSLIVNSLISRDEDVIRIAVYFILNPMDNLFTAWKSYFIVIFTDKSGEVTSK